MFSFKGTTNTAMHVVMESTPKMPKGKKNIERIAVPGRSGFLSIDNGTYDSFIISVPCHLDLSAANIDDVKYWLDGSGKLSFDGIRQWDAVVVNSIDFERVVSTFRSFVIQFECQPFAEDITESVFIADTNPDTLTITGATANMEPICEITGNGTVSVTVNGESFHLDMDGTKFTLDSKLKVIVDSTGANASDRMLYDFPILKPGENVISTIGTVTELKFTYRRAYL